MLEEFSSRVQRATEAAGDDLSAHLFDPVNAFQLVNRYTNGWMKLDDTVYQDNSGGAFASNSPASNKSPLVDPSSVKSSAITVDLPA